MGVLLSLLKQQIKLPTRAQVWQGVRVAVAVAGPISLHICLADKVPASIREDFVEATLWASVTVIMSTLSVMGRAAVIYTERSAGTAVGGLVAWALLAACSRPAYLSVLSVALVWLGQVLTSGTPRGYQFPLARMIGILGGVLVSSLTSALLLPVTASRQAVEHVEAALRGLVALSEATWAPYKATLQQQQQHQQQAQPTAGSAPPAAHALEAPPVQVASRRVGAPPAAGALNPQLDPEAGTPHGLKDPQLDPEAGTPHGLKEDGWEAQQQGPAQLGGLRQQAGVPEASATRDVDSAMDATWACFRKIAEALADMPHEVFLGRLLGGRLDCFIPGTPFDPGRRPYVPPASAKAVLAAMRACVRLQYSLHLALAPGFSTQQLAILRSIHSLGLLAQLPALTAAAFTQVLHAYRAALHGGGGGSGGCKAGDGAGGAVAALAAAAHQLQANSLANREALQRLLARLQAQQAQQAQHGSQQPSADGKRGFEGQAADEGLLHLMSAQLSMRPEGHNDGSSSRFHGMDAAPGGVPALIRFHSLEYLLEQLAEHVRQLQEAIRDLVAWLPR